MSAKDDARQGSLTTRLLWMTVAVVTLALGLSSFIILRQFQRELHEGFEGSTVVLAKTLAEHCQAPLVFQDADGATQIMSHMARAEFVKRGVLYDSTGAVFARFGGSDEPKGAVRLPSATVRTRGQDEVTITEPIFHEGQRIGALRLVASSAGVHQRERTVRQTTLAAMALGIAAACLLGLFLQRGVTRPILHLARAMRGIHGSRPLQPVPHQGKAEIGVLYHGFNEMIARLDADRAARDSSEGRLRALMAALPDPVFLLGDDGQVSEIDKDTGTHSARAGHDDERPAALQIPPALLRERVSAALAAQQPQRWAYSVESPDGTRWFDAVLVPLPVGTGEEARRLVLFVPRDLTERHRLEDELRQSQKMDALGRLAGGVAHDFNNILTAIAGYGEILRAQLVAERLDPHDANEILRGADRAARLTRQLLAFSRRQVSSRHRLSLSEIIAEMRDMLERLIGEEVELVTVLSPDTPPLDGDPVQLEQVVMNLVINARDAMPSGGTITLETGRAQLPDGSQAAVMEVRDTGLGMDDDTRARIFEPFFTTKALRGGTGLGLATVYGIVRSMNAEIVVDSTPGEGATFRITFAPATAEPATLPPRRITQIDGAHPVSRVLLVEDEPQLRAMAERVLRDAGCEVLVAENGEAALRLFKDEPAAIDLVLADVVMPGMGGVPLMKAVRQLRPSVKVILMSGYADDVMVQHGVARGQVRFLSKPFTLDELRQQVSEALGKAGARHDAAGS